MRPRPDPDGSGGANATPTPGPGPRRPAGLLPARVTVPTVPAGMVSRPRLLAALDESADALLTVVSAGPGWGKTSTVSAWAAARADSPVAWLSLDAEDDSLATFWTAVFTAIIATGALPPDHPVRQLSLGAAMSTELMESTYRALLALPADSVLVLDDFHAITDADVLESLNTLLRRPRQPLRLILLSRADPVLRVHRLRLSGSLCEITADDLGFTRDELPAIAQAAGLELSAEVLDRVHERTAGWPAGVRLAMLHLARTRAGSDLAGFGGSNTSVAEYFVAEVLESQPPQTRAFLLGTSVTDRLCADLAAALTPRHDGQQILEALARGNEFVVALGADHTWYRYHPLLREMLEHLLERDDPTAWRAAHASAARWFAHHGEPLRALRHAERAGDWELLATVMVEAGWPLLLGKDRQLARAVLAAVPLEDLEPTAPLTLCSGALAFIDGRMQAVEAHVSAARAMIPDTPEELRLPTAALVEMLEIAAARGRSDVVTLRDACLAGRSLADRAERWFPALPSVVAVSAVNLAVAELWSGQVEAAAELFSRAAAAATEAGVDLAAMNAWAHLALCHLVAGRLDEADEVAAMALTMAAAAGQSSSAQLRNAHLAQAVVALLRGRTDDADRAAATGLAATNGGVEAATTTALQLCFAMIAVSRGRSRAAGRALQEANQAARSWQPPRFVSDWLTRTTVETTLVDADPEACAAAARALEPDRDDHVAIICRARLLLAAGDGPAADEAAHDVLERAELAGVDAVTRVEAHLVLALSANRQRRDHEAREHCARAVAAATPGRIWRPFQVSESHRVATLVRHVEAGRSGGDSSAELLRLLRGADTAPPEPDPLLEPLTDRELTILWALPTMQTNTEIADDLFVSVNTVKTHLRTLYRKLDVANRREAIRRGRELGLLS